MAIPSRITPLGWVALFGIAPVALALAACAEDPADLKIAIDSPADGDSVHVGAEISFEGSVRGGESPIQLNWVFDAADAGAVTPATSEDKNPAGIVFEEPATYQIVFSGEDDKLQEDSDSIEIVATYDSLELTITSPEEDQSIGVGESVSFAAELESGEEPVDVSWDFDSTGVGSADPATSSDLEPGAVTFNAPGEYVVTLTATDSADQEFEASVVVEAHYEQAVTGFTATSGDTQITLAWTFPTDPDYQSVLIRRSTSAAPTEPDDPSDDPIVPASGATSHVDESLTNGTEYFYTIFAYNAGMEFGVGASASATPADVTPPADVTGFTATAASDSQIDLSWTNPTDTDFAKVKIRRATSGCPFFPTDGDSVYDDDGTSTSDSSLSADTQYYYTAFAYDEVPNYSAGVCVNATTQP